MSAIAQMKSNRNYDVVSFKKGEFPDTGYLALGKICKLLNVSGNCFDIYEEGGEVIVAFSKAYLGVIKTPTKDEILAMSVTDEELEVARQFSPGEPYEEWLTRRVETILREKKLI